MVCKFLLLAVVCIAQGLAYQPLDGSRGNNVCKNPALEIPFEFEETVHEMDEVRDTVSMAAMEAYAKGSNMEVIIACFVSLKDNYVSYGERIFGLIRDASQEMTEKLGEKAEEYAKLMEGPLQTIAITIRALPETVYNFIQNKEFIKAAEAVRQARKIVEENSKVLAQIVEDMAAEVPELADRAEEMAREIRREAREGAEVINQLFQLCVKEGGPQKLAPSSE